MIKNREKLEAFEKQFIAGEPIDIQKNFRIYNAMYQEAVRLGIFPLKDPLEGIEIDIKVARIANSV